MSDLDRLFYWRGIAPDFYNFKGELTPVSLDKRIKILEAMGVDTSTPETIAKEAFELDIKPWLSWLPPLEVIPDSHPSVEINFRPEELGKSVQWTLENESGKLAEGDFIPKALPEVGDYLHEGQRYSRRELSIGSFPPNYYTISLKMAERIEHTTLAVTPNTAYEPSWVEDDSANLWGFVVQLYTLRSVSNWGIGDFSDLLELVGVSGKYDADIIGLNPFHALQSDLKHNFSPYAPSDRRFLNPLYIDVELAPGYEEELKPEDLIDRARGLDHVDYELIRSIKYQTLYLCFERMLLSSPNDFAAYLRGVPEGLIDFANFEALTNWQPEDLVPEPIKLAELLASLETASMIPATHQLVAFHCYLQWVAETQLQKCQALAQSSGMKIGLVRDLAVGASGSGSEAQTNAQLFCRQAAIGAPPDPFSHIGQNWGIPPMDPAELRRTGFKHYIALLRANMANCGALRIDHAMSLYRLWWCPSGQDASHGAYIYYPFREMMGLLCLESWLNKCVIIAEDLGVVPDEFRAAMSKTKLYANRVFYFEKWHDTEMKHPQHYERHALAMLDNHDVPTLSSWWNVTDLELRKSLNLFESEEEYWHQRNIRKAEKENLAYQMAQEGLLPASWLSDSGAVRSVEDEIDFVLLEAIVQFVGLTKAQFFILQLEDLLMMNDPVNVPSTFLEHKNWSRKLIKNTKDIFSDKNIDSLLHGVASVRKGIKGS